MSGRRGPVEEEFAFFGEATKSQLPPNVPNVPNVLNSAEVAARFGGLLDFIVNQERLIIN
jgi:hypothetical protein